MAPSFANTRGYHAPNTFNAANLKNIELPAKIQCSRCKKWKNQSNFSNKQKAEARLLISRQGVNAKLALKCVSCSGQPAVELECVSCKHTKGLDAFAKAQRKNPDHAVS